MISNEAECEIGTNPFIKKAHVFGVHIDEGSHKRACDSSPLKSYKKKDKAIDVELNSPKPEVNIAESQENKQLIKWQPSIAKILKKQVLLGYPYYMPPSTHYSSPATSTNSKGKKEKAPASPSLSGIFSNYEEDDI